MKGRQTLSTLSQRLAGIIILCRKKQGLTQAALAEKAGISRSHLQVIESGKANPRLTTMARLSIGLNVEILVRLFPPGHKKAKRTEVTPQEIERHVAE